MKKKEKIKKDWENVKEKVESREKFIVDHKIPLGPLMETTIESHVNKEIQEFKDFIIRTLKTLGATDQEIKDTLTNTK